MCTGPVFEVVLSHFCEVNMLLLAELYKELSLFIHRALVSLSTSSFSWVSRWGCAFDWILWWPGWEKEGASIFVCFSSPFWIELLLACHEVPLLDKKF